MTREPLVMGAVAYDPKVVPIWDGIREYVNQAGAAMDYVLFSNYEAQVDALLEGFIDIAWNTNLAYVRTYNRTNGRCREQRRPPASATVGGNSGHHGDGCLRAQGLRNVRWNRWRWSDEDAVTTDEPTRRPAAGRRVDSVRRV